MRESPGIGSFAAAVFVPPLAVHFRCGPGRDFWIACALTLLGWLPGIGFALWALLRRESVPAA